MRHLLAASLAASLAVAPFATCGRAPAAGVTYDCPDGRAFTVTYTDSSTAVVHLDAKPHRLAAATKGATRWTDGTMTLTTTGDTARLERADGVVGEGCLARNPELRRG